MAQMEERFGGHAWLSAKMEQLHRLAEEDMEMMINHCFYVDKNVFFSLTLTED